MAINLNDALYTVMALLKDHPTYKPPHFLLITCAALTTGSGTYVANVVFSSTLQ